MRHIAPSAEITKSAASSSLWSRMNASRLGLPISSSPSNMNFTLIGSAPTDCEERFGDLDRDEHRSLVVRHAARVEPSIANRRRERRTVPLVERVGRLHVVVPVDERGQRARRAEPLAVHDGIAGRRDRADRDRSGGRELRRDPSRRRRDVGGVRGIGAHARNRRELDQLGEYAIVVRLESREHDSQARGSRSGRRQAAHHLPPSIDSTWPVIHLA